jgi:hypothetical protein
LAPDILQALDYARVVEAFYRSMTVIPMRYGCQVTALSEAASLLEKRRDDYETLLRELAGVGEIGIHILPDGPTVRPENDLSPPPPNPSSTMSGTAYLAAKRQRYLGLEWADLEQRGLVEELCSPLLGLYVRRKVEWPNSTTSPLLSLYFLVPRDSMDSFRDAARQLRSRPSLKLLLSGPWPPYNFVDSF